MPVERDPSDMDDWQETWHRVHDVLGHKWAFHVLRALADGDRGFNGLKDDLRVRSKALSARLSDLRCAGLVEREVEATTPPRTTYRLTEEGAEFVGALLRIEEMADVVPCGCGDDCETLSVADPPTCEC
ncbi:winged helix-turn-helix transcriptional regulator [Halobacterium litoreum]|uniref:Winged helix-turn-helix transcriptional regulator n=1 Tax=Halobacterium litoreum TaxID=2039234 RepID=A0ABD5N9C3_9EURY|nr:helix-turn-helix domain-containing protein [Halobacterium litoreum]UHH12043.1 helix-turn-helix transcriptional regulator [Halobacterium litoreum]